MYISLIQWKKQPKKKALFFDMDKDFLHNFFHVASRIILILPFVIIFIVLAMRYQVFNSSNEPLIRKRGQSTITSKKAQKTETSSTVLNAEQKKGLDVKNDFICSFFDKESSVSAFKKENNILIRNKNAKETNNYLVNGDCLFQWKEGSSTGKKTCGIGQYVSIAQTLYSTGLIDIDTLMNYIPKNISVASQSAIPLAKIKQVFQSCVNKEVKEKRLFEIPKMPWL